MPKGLEVSLDIAENAADFKTLVRHYLRGVHTLGLIRVIRVERADSQCPPWIISRPRPGTGSRSLPPHATPTAQPASQRPAEVFASRPKAQGSSLKDCNIRPAVSYKAGQPESLEGLSADTSPRVAQLNSGQDASRPARPIPAIMSPTTALVDASSDLVPGQGDQTAKSGSNKRPHDHQDTTAANLVPNAAVEDRIAKRHRLLGETLRGEPNLASADPKHTRKISKQMVKVR